MANLSNWAGNLTYGTANLHQPTNVAEVQEMVRRHEKLRALGTRHSFNAIADSDAAMISMERLDRILALDRARQTVTIEAGVKYGQLGEYLHAEGFALHNLASLPDISVAGAVATATHGSGVGNRNLSAAVIGMEIVKADGEVVSVSREQTGEAFDGMVVSLGGLGVVTKLTLKVEPTFHVAQGVFEALPRGEWDEHFDAIMSSAYSVSLFTDWQSDHIDQVWVKQRVTESDPATTYDSFFGARLAHEDRHPIKGISAENCTAQRGIPGAWHERLPHFRSGCTPSAGAELQAEYFVPRSRAVPALRAIERLRPHLAPLLLVSEIRTIAADTFWMSPCYEQDSVGIHFTLKQEPAVKALLPLIERELAPFNPRPHWGKLFEMAPAQLQSRYARLRDFQSLLGQFDPAGKFRNAFLERYLF